MQNKVSGKPDAGEWATRRMWKEWGQGGFVVIRPMELAAELADFQRETLLWAAKHFRDKYLDEAAYLPATELERLAESCGRGKWGAARKLLEPK